ncbi:ATPase family associated with various cellular activities [Actinidia rufa]|uniref:ATPase family associated with various cellular activities n=1 Tax=Actinidia rufa TaxID=165716 RepID=A0A7J0GGF1_9ERIC|nr:ATPase family associated with various cellular activities [Actinidia rufa]
MAPVMQSSQPWVEKYRPKQVKDVAHQDEVVRVLTNTLETANCPHMLFYGPPGTGKTTTALAIAHQLFGPELYKSRVLELNASDDRGINVVRTKIKNFAAVAVGSGRQGGYPCPPFKIIILDEADSMTEDAQAKCFEAYDGNLLQSHEILFHLIIEPLASRCAKFRFKPLSEDIMTGRILHICKEEGLNLDSEALSTLSSISQGDLRRAITYLQGAARLFGSSISSKDLISVSGVIPQEVVQALFAACSSSNFDLANKEVTNVIAEGYPVSQMLSQLFEVVVVADDISDEQKAKICKKLAEADKCLIDGADEYLQLLDVASITMRVLCVHVGNRALLGSESYDPGMAPSSNYDEVLLVYSFYPLTFRHLISDILSTKLMPIALFKYILIISKSWKIIQQY